MATLVTLIERLVTDTQTDGQVNAGQ